MTYPTTASLAYKIDHVGVSLADAAAAYAFCTDALRLPVAWTFADYGTARTGGIGLGNLNLEVLDAATIGLPVHDPAAIGLVAFQRAPETYDVLVAALAARGVPAAGQPFTTGNEIFGFTNLLLPPLGPDLAFFCGYHYPGSHDNAVRAAELDAVGGGTIGLRGVTEVRAAIDPAGWEPILGPPTVDRWSFDTGPDFVVDPSVEAGGAEMTWSVRDVGVAVDALERAGDGQPDGDALVITGLGGLRVRLTDGAPARPARLAARRAAQF